MKNRLVSNVQIKIYRLRRVKSNLLVIERASVKLDLIKSVQSKNRLVLECVNKSLSIHIILNTVTAMNLNRGIFYSAIFYLQTSIIFLCTF